MMKHLLLMTVTAPLLLTGAPVFPLVCGLPKLFIKSHPPDKRLNECTDHEVGELMEIVQDRFAIFEAEFAVCHHARRRLMLRNSKELSTK
jgi:cytochrome c oxidase assembly factor CtaG